MRDLGKLLRKEFRLAAMPLTYFFTAGALFVMIPNYPALVGAFFVCLGIFYSFQSAREANDVLYTALLPLPKKAFVEAKFAFTGVIQAAAFLLFVLFTGIRTALGDLPAYRDSALMKPNLAMLGYVLLIYALFNAVFLGGFFKTAYAIGKPFLFFALLTFPAIAAAEVLPHLPGLGFLDGAGDGGIWLRAAVLFASAVLYAVSFLLTMKKAERRFEKIDL